mgnify:CR=1 FL=1
MSDFPDKSMLYNEDGTPAFLFNADTREATCGADYVAFMEGVRSMIEAPSDELEQPFSKVFVRRGEHPEKGSDFLTYYCVTSKQVIASAFKAVTKL